MVVVLLRHDGDLGTGVKHDFDHLGLTEAKVIICME